MDVVEDRRDSPADADLRCMRVEERAFCGGTLTARPDEQYGEVLVCDRCGQEYA